MSAADLQLHIELDKIDNGQVEDLSGNGNQGAVQGNISVVPDDKFGSCLEFGGTIADYILFDALTGLPADISEITVSLWMKGTKGSPFSYAVPGSPNELAFYRAGTSTMDIVLNEVSKPISGLSSDDSWHHLAFSWQQSDGKLTPYVDGLRMPEMTTTTVPLSGTGGKVVIGNKQDEDLDGVGEPEEVFQGKIAHVRWYTRVLSEEEILQDKQSDEDAYSAHRQTHPLTFDLVNSDDDHVLYIKNFGALQDIYFKIHNSSKKTIELETLVGEVSKDNSHFEIKFRPGILKNTGDIDLHISQQSDWTMTKVQPTPADNYFYIFLKKEAAGMMTVNGSEYIRLTGIQPDGSLGTRGAKVGFRFQHIMYTGESNTLLEGTQEESFNIVNQRGSSHIPLHAALISKEVFIDGDHVIPIGADNQKNYCGITVLNDGTTSNNLLIALTNVKPNNIDGKQITFASNSKIRISFVSDYEDDSAIANNSHVSDAAIHAPNSNWLPVQSDSENTEVYWEIQPKPGSTVAPLDAGHEHSLLIPITNLQSDKPDGYTQIYVHYENIPGYQDGKFVLPVLKAPLYIKEKKIGIGTNSPDGHLSVVDDVESSEVKIHLGNKNQSGYSAIRFSDEDTGNGKAYLKRFNSISNTNGALEESDSIGFYESVGSMNIGAQETFKVFTGGISNNKERLRITKDGKVGIGTNSPDGHLSIVDDVENSEVKIRLTNKSQSGYSVIRFSDEDTGNGKAYLHRFNSQWNTSGAWEANSIGFYESVGSMNIGAQETFKVYTGGTSNNHERLKITNDGSHIKGNLTVDNNLSVDSISGNGIAPYLKKNDLISTHGIISMQNRQSGYHYDDWTKNYADVSPPFGYSIGDLVGFTASMDLYQFSGNVNGDDLVWCRYWPNYNGSGKIRIIASTSENAQGASLLANYLAIWKK